MYARRRVAHVLRMRWIGARAALRAHGGVVPPTRARRRPRVAIRRLRDIDRLSDALLSRYCRYYVYKIRVACTAVAVYSRYYTSIYHQARVNQIACKLLVRRETGPATRYDARDRRALPADAHSLSRRCSADSTVRQRPSARPTTTRAIPRARLRGGGQIFCSICGLDAFDARAAPLFSSGLADADGSLVGPTSGLRSTRSSVCMRMPSVYALSCLRISALSSSIDASCWRTDTSTWSSAAKSST